MDLLRLHNALAAVCPIEGVSVTDPNDKTTWRIAFQPGATSAQKAAAQSAVAAFDPTIGPPRKVSIKQLLYAVNELGKRDLWDAWLATQSRNTQDYFVVESDTLETNLKVRRGAEAIGVPVKDLIQLALSIP